MSIYLDASVLVPRMVEEPGTTAVDAYLAGRSDARLVSDFAAAEVASALSRLVRMRLLSDLEATATLSDFDIWRATATTQAEVQPADARLAYVLVRRFDLKLRASDALHLAIARRVGATLVTLDVSLATAAGELGVPAAVPGTDSAAAPA